jgi:hypothetical protein
VLVKQVSFSLWDDTHQGIFFLKHWDKNFSFIGLLSNLLCVRVSERVAHFYDPFFFVVRENHTIHTQHIDGSQEA